MRHILASFVFLFACSSVETHNGGGGGADGGGGGGADAMPDAIANVTGELIGIWDITTTDGATGCTATFTDGISIQCTDDPQTTSESGCLRQNTLTMTGSWIGSLTLSLDEAEDYSGTCVDPAHVDSMSTFATMTAMRTAAGTGTGLWQEASGSWHVEGIDPAMPDAGAQITCDATFTPGASTTSVTVTCATPWDDSDNDMCSQRSTTTITASYMPGLVSVTINGQSEKMGTTCLTPLIEAWDPFDLTATKR